MTFIRYYIWSGKKTEIGIPERQKENILSRTDGIVSEMQFGPRKRKRCVFVSICKIESGVAGAAAA